MAFDAGHLPMTTRLRVNGDITYILIRDYSMMASELVRLLAHFADLRDDEGAEAVRPRLIKEIEGLLAAARALKSEIAWRTGCQ